MPTVRINRDLNPKCQITCEPIHLTRWFYLYNLQRFHQDIDIWAPEEITVISSAKLCGFVKLTFWVNRILMFFGLLFNRL
jgi:hypothetical protein